MQAGTFIRSDVQALSSRVLVDGTERAFTSWNVDRDLSSDLPAGVAGGNGITQATGQIVWAGRDVESGARNPWNRSTGWIPPEGSKVEIYAGDGVTEWKQFTGVIDNTSGSIGSSFSSKIIDRIDDLSERAKLPSLVDVMPPVEKTGPWRRFRLTPLWAAMMALRRSGFYATPAVETNSVFDVPAFGGMWPYQGNMLTCHRQSTEDLAPITPFSTHVADVYARYEPTSNLAGTATVQLTMKVAAQHAGIASLQVMYGGSYLTLRATGTRNYAMINGVVVAEIPRSGAEVLQAIFKNGNAQIRSSSGQNASGNAAWGVSVTMSEVRVIADADSVVNGFIVSHPTAQAEFANLGWKPTAHIINGVMHGAMAGLRATKDGSARELLDDISGSLLWPYWIDELGVMQMLASDFLRAQAPALKLTTLDDIRELSWQRDLLGRRKSVIASYDKATINRRSDYSLPVWESGESVVLQSGESHATIIDPGQEEWLMVDTAWKTIAQAEQLNKGVGSWIGGVYTDGVSEIWTNTEGQGQQATYKLELTGEGVYKATATALSLDAGKQVELRSVSRDITTGSVLWPFWWDKSLPIIRAKGKFVTDKVDRPPVAASNAAAPILEHDCGLWATGNNPDEETLVVDRIAGFLAEQTTNPHPTITGLSVGFDPRIQLGDVVLISSPKFMGVELTCLIVGKNSSASSSGYRMELSVRVLAATTTMTTYAEYDKSLAQASLTYLQWQGIEPVTQTYDAFNDQQ